MKKVFMSVVLMLLVLTLMVPAYAAPEDEYPEFYADVPWSIPSGMELYTVPTKFAPSTDGMTGYNPFCKEADCTVGCEHAPCFKTIHDYIRDYTEDTIAGAATPEAAAKRIFYEVRDFIEYENIDFFGAFIAYRYKAGNSGMKASLANAMYRSAKIPARLVIQPATTSPDYLGYNYANNTKLFDDSTLDSAVFGSYHIYGEVYINGQWLKSDPAFDSGLADAFKVAKFGTLSKSVVPTGTPVIEADYTDEFLASQPHPYLFNQNVDPAVYDEKDEAKNHVYFRAYDDELNRYIKNVRYRTTSRRMAGVVKYSMDELGELLDIIGNSPDKTKAQQAKNSLQKALSAIQQGKTTQAIDHMKAAEGAVRGLSLFLDDLDIMTVRTRLAYFTHRGDAAVLKAAEANPPTYNVVEPFDNATLNWQVLYGYDDWKTPAMEGYILENLYIQWFASMGVPMKIDTILSDYNTVLVDPTNPMPEADDIPPILVDHFGNRYNPETTPYVFDGLVFGYTPFLSSDDTAVYSIPVPNGFPDLFEADGNARIARYKRMGAWEWQRAEARYDDQHVANRFLDKYSHIPFFPIFAMDNDVARDTVDRIAESGATKLLFNGNNNLVADFTYDGYEWEMKKYIAEGGYNLEYIQVETYGKTVPYIEGFVNKLEEEMNNYPDGSRMVVSLVSHGFPYHDYVYTAYGYPGCTKYWLPGSPYDCGDIWPTGYIYGADQWHQNNWDQMDLIVEEIVSRGTGPGTLFYKLDSNGDGNIKNDELIQSGNMFSSSSYDPYNMWIGSEEWFGNQVMDDGMGGELILPPKLKEKIDYERTKPGNEDYQLDYFVDIPYYWDIESTETVMHRHMLMPMMEGMSHDTHMIWFDDNHRSETVFDPHHFMDIWDMGMDMNMHYEPINVVVTRMLMQGTTALHDAYMEKFDKAVSELP